MLGRCRRRWANIESALGQRLVFGRSYQSVKVTYLSKKTDADISVDLHFDLDDISSEVVADKKIAWNIYVYYF